MDRNSQMGMGGDGDEALRGWVGMENKSMGMGEISVPMHISNAHNLKKLSRQKSKKNINILISYTRRL